MTENSRFFIVDLSDPDAPSYASTLITDDGNGWWGNMQRVGDAIWASHYEWYEHRAGDFNRWRVRYFADRMDLSDRAHPRIAAKINTPGLIIGGSDRDPSILYTIDYGWE